MSAFSVRPAVTADVDRIVDIQFAAFQTPIGAWLGEGSPINIVETRKSRFATLVKDCSENYVACDKDGRVMAYACYGIKGRETIQTPSPLGTLESILYNLQQDVNHILLYWQNSRLLKERQRRLNLFVTALDADLEQTVQNAKLDQYVYLELLAVHPEAQGLGVGSTLLRMSMDLAVKHDLPLVLQSSTKGFPFYMKKDFAILGPPFELWDNGELIGSLPNLVWNRARAIVD